MGQGVGGVRREEGVVVCTAITWHQFRLPVAGLVPSAPSDRASLVIGGQVSPGLSLAIPLRHRERLRIHVERTGHLGGRPILPACAGACPPTQPDQALSLGTADVRGEHALTARGATSTPAADQRGAVAVAGRPPLSTDERSSGRPATASY